MCGTHRTAPPAHHPTPTPCARDRVSCWSCTDGPCTGPRLGCNTWSLVSPTSAPSIQSRPYRCETSARKIVHTCWGVHEVGPTEWRDNSTKRVERQIIPRDGDRSGVSDVCTTTQCIVVSQLFVLKFLLGTLSVLPQHISNKFFVLHIFLMH